MAGGWGGKRVGSGPKPKSRKERWLGGNAGKRPLALVPSSPIVPSVLVAPVEIEAPALLTSDEAAYWALWAPLAITRGTLNGETRPGLVLLCQTARRSAEMWSDIVARGMVYEKVTIDGAGQEHREYKAHPLLSHWRALMTRTEQLQARYGIAADGKVVVEADTDTEETALAKLLAVR